MKNKTKEIIGIILHVILAIAMHSFDLFSENNIVLAVVPALAGFFQLGAFTGMGAGAFGALAATKFGSMYGGAKGRAQIELDKTFRIREAQSQKKRSKKELDRLRNIYTSINAVNPYLNMENKMEDMTINQRQFQFERDSFQRSQKNILDTLRPSAGASGASSLVQSLVRQREVNEQRISADTAQQEAANVAPALLEKQRLQALEAQGSNIPNIFKEQQMGSLLGATQQEYMMNKQLQEQYYSGEMGRMSSARSFAMSQNSAIGSTVSDRRLKKNIKHIDNSPSGIKIYKFEYIDDSLGKGIYQGVMSDEIPQEAVIKHASGFDAVDYSKLDVKFKNII